MTGRAKRTRPSKPKPVPMTGSDFATAALCLPPQFAQVVMLRYGLGDEPPMMNIAIAERLGIPARTVGTRLFRGLASIRAAGIEVPEPRECGPEPKFCAYAHDRALAVLEVLRCGERMGAESVAEHFPITRGALQVVVKHLRALGAPINSRPGRTGGYQLEDVDWAMPDVDMPQQPPQGEAFEAAVLTGARAFLAEHGHRPRTNHSDAEPYVGFPATWSRINSALRAGSFGIRRRYSGLPGFLDAHGVGEPYRPGMRKIKVGGRVVLLQNEREVA